MPKSILRPDPSSRFVPSLAALFRVGFAASLIMILQAVAGRLAWRTKGFPFGVNYDPSTGRFWVQDFAHIFGLTKAFALGAVDSPYNLHERLRFMAQWVGQPIDLALGYGYSPTFWLILSPLLPLRADFAYVIWSLLPAFILLAIAWHLLANGWSERNPLALTLILIALASGSYQGEVQVGKTVAVLGLITIWLIMASTDPRSEVRSAVPLFLLTASPPLALAMGAGLLWNRQTKTVLLAAGLVLLEVACVTSWLGSGWIHDYLEVLTHYDSDTAPESFRAFVAPRGMSNVRHLLVVGAGWTDRSASLASVAAWGVAIACGTWLALRDRIPAGRLRPAFSLLLFSIFSPHLTFSNDLVVVTVVWFLHAELNLRGAARIVAVVALVLVVNSGPFKTFFLNDLGAHVALAAKIAVAALFVAQCARVAPSRPAG
jgi:hypothetical protein